ncbi:MAG TPA: nucleoside kinase, partial [Lachnospiraceae bacterium]|nr:nucleoside kinase [Lachnospiraceae bacterium]
KRILKLLGYFVGIDSTRVPMNSLLREFIGGSAFKV